MKNISFLFFSVILAACVTAQSRLGVEDSNQKSYRKPQVAKPRLVPFFAMSKECGFQILRADKAHFIEMESIMLTIPKELKGALPVGTNVVQLTYGAKMSGVGAVYLTPKKGSLTAEKALMPLIEKKILKDRQYFKTWTIKTMSHPTLLVLVSGTTPAVQALLSKSLK